MQRKGQNKRSITRCFLCMNLYAQQIKVRPSLSTDSCTMLAGKSTVFSTSPIIIATVHEIHLQFVFSVVIVALCLLFCKLFFLFFTYRIKIHSICLNSHGIPFSNESPAFCILRSILLLFVFCDWVWALWSLQNHLHFLHSQILREPHLRSWKRFIF